MNVEDIIRGTLFARDFLTESIADSDEWKSIDDEELDALEGALVSILDAFPLDGSANESQTEDDLIWPILERFGWTDSLRQQNLSTKGREDVPDGLLFAGADAKRRANNCDEEWRRYEFGTVLVESKRWLRPLDHRSGRPGEESAPSTQMLRYLRRVEDLTTGRLRWGILTNGACWRLYYQGARSVSEDYFEFDFRHIFGLSEYGSGLFAVTDEVRRHCLRVVALVLRREAFVPTGADPRTFHQRAIDESRYFEAKVASDLSDLVFGSVFPGLAGAMAEAAPDAPLGEIREATLVLLYRLLFIHFAEDRGLLPIMDKRYEHWAIRFQVRVDIGRRKDEGDVFSTVSTRYWNHIDDLSRLIDAGDQSMGLPPYDGGLFDRQRVPLLSRVRLCDAVLAEVIDALSFGHPPGGQRQYINYSDLSVQQLGSIYERLIEHEFVRNGPRIEVRPNIFARKTSGSYYTSDDLVGLIIDETLGPLVRTRLDAFDRAVTEARVGAKSGPRAIEKLKRLDPAENILQLRVCDPAMGSGHFLVRVVDYLTERVIAAMCEVEASVDGYTSPLTNRIHDIRTTIVTNAKEGGWTIDPARLDDRHIVRRVVLKRCIYGVDKNPMAVELAKVALWLHTFTVGAPLNFLDHHLRCGDSLFGSWVRKGIDKAKERGGQLFLDEPIRRAVRAQEAIQVIEGLSDSEIAEANRSSEIYSGVEERTAPLQAFLSLVHAFDWLNIRSVDGEAALKAYFAGTLGDPIELAMGRLEVQQGSPESKKLADLLDKTARLVKEERFLSWQVAFPGVWTDWEAAELQGGFDAIVGNPPWDRIKLQQVEWFSSRRPEIAMTGKAADRKRMIADLETNGDPLAEDYAFASERASAAMRMARHGGDFPLLGRGDINLYSLFVERSMSLLNRGGLMGLLTPSGIAGDLTAADFFKSVSTEGRLRALFDFENRRLGYDQPPFFPAVDSRFKFCALVASKSKPEVGFQAVPGEQPLEMPARCAFFLHSVEEVRDPDRWFPMAANQFARVNPNTGTAPVLRTRRAASLTTSIYERMPVLVNRSGGNVVKAWPVAYRRMFDMTNDSNLFRTRYELEETEGAWPVGNNRYDSTKGEWVPLYEGKMVQAYDHRAASIVVNPENRHRPAQPHPATLEQHQDPSWLPNPQYWVLSSSTGGGDEPFFLVFKDVTAPTNMRSMIAALVPRSGTGNTLPVISTDGNSPGDLTVLLANFNAIPFDFAARQKIQGQHLNWFVVEQLPVVPPTHYESVCFGHKTAGEIVREVVLELTYTAHDMAPFARELGYTNQVDKVKPPFPWSRDRRLSLQAKLDAVYFCLYGITSREDVRFVYSTFPIVEEKEVALYGTFRSRDLCLAYMNALNAGEIDLTIPV